MSFFSVIVPVYKIKETLLRSCLESLKKQSSYDVEFLIIDDGSPDNCGIICDEYSKFDSRFHVFHLENAGVSVARNYGLKKASGYYVTFLDGDDRFNGDIFYDLIQNIKTECKDIFFFRYKTISENDLVSDSMQTASINIIRTDFTQQDVSNVVVSNGEGLSYVTDINFGSPWAKFFKRSFLINNNIYFPLGIKKSQDRIFILKTMAFHPSMAIIDYYGYYYIENDNSICQAYNPDIINILEKSADEFLSTINTLFSDEIRDELLKSYDYLQYDFLFNMMRLDFFHKNHTKKIDDLHDFIELCKTKRKYYIKCKIKYMGKKRS